MASNTLENNIPLRTPHYDATKLYTIFYPIILIVPLFFAAIMLWFVPMEETITRTSKLVNVKQLKAMSDMGLNTATFVARNYLNPGLLMPLKK